MKVLDDEHVFVEYLHSFNVPGISKIKAAIVMKGNQRYGTTDKTKLNPCETQKFHVRIAFAGEPTYVNSLPAKYQPGNMEQVSQLTKPMPISNIWKHNHTKFN